MLIQRLGSGRHTAHVWLLMACLLNPGILWACRYNVRDIGFVDYDTEAYRLYGLVRTATSQEIISSLRQTANQILKDSNVNFDLVNIDITTEHPALKQLSSQPEVDIPTGILVSPDGQAHSISFSDRGQITGLTILAAMQRIVSSPKREEIMKKAIQSFAVVLLIEGQNPEENRRVRKAIAGSIDQIKQQLKSMPKTIAQPPALVTLESESMPQEQVLLWSLRVVSGSMKQALAAIIYGRARWMGPLMKGEEITESNLTGILSIIGADCECGMDLSWTQGTRLPIPWDSQRQSEAASVLGFDPENPLVKVEVSRILSRQGAIKPRSSDYSNRSNETISSNSVQALTLAQLATPITSSVSNKVSKIQNPGMDEVISRRIIVSMAGISIILMAVGIWIYFRGAR